VSAHAPYLMDFQQQDSQEFLRFLLDGMSEDLCRKHSEAVEQGGAGSGGVGSGGKGANSGGGILPMLPSPSLSLTNPTNNNNSSSAANSNSSPDFSRTLPTHLTHNTVNTTDVFSMSLSAQNSPIANPLRTSHTTKLREQAHSSRHDELRVNMHKSHSAMHSSADSGNSGGNIHGVYSTSGSNDEADVPIQIPRLRNNNHEEEAHTNTTTNTNTGNTNATQQTPSKYVSRLRKFSAASPDEPQLRVFSPESKHTLHPMHFAHTPHTPNTNTPNHASAPNNTPQHAHTTPSTTHTPHTPTTTHTYTPNTTHTTSDKSRVNALLRSADEGEDFSPEDTPVSDILRLSIEGIHNSSVGSNSTHHTNYHTTHTHHTTNNNNTTTNNNTEEVEPVEDAASRRLRKKPSRRHSKLTDEQNNTNNTAVTTTNTDPVTLAMAQNITLSQLSYTVVQRLLAAQHEAKVAWGKYLKLNDSVITDLFAGQLQSTIECMTCRHRYVNVFVFSVLRDYLLYSGRWMVE